MKRKYQITVFYGNHHPKGQAQLITNEGDGYLWLGNENGDCIGWIDNRQLDALSKSWLRVREGGRTPRAVDLKPQSRVKAKSRKASSH